MNFRRKVKAIVEGTQSPDEKVKAIRARAKAENRELTDDERTEIVAQAGRKMRLKKSKPKAIRPKSQTTNEDSNHPFYQKVKALSRNRGRKSQSINDSINHPYYGKVKVIVERGFLGKIGRGVANAGMLGLQALRLGRFQTGQEHAEDIRQDMAKRKAALDKSKVGGWDRVMKQRHERERALGGTDDDRSKLPVSHERHPEAKTPLTKRTSFTDTRPDMSLSPQARQAIAHNKSKAGQEAEAEAVWQKGRVASGRAHPKYPR